MGGTAEPVGRATGRPTWGSGWSRAGAGWLARRHNQFGPGRMVNGVEGNLRAETSWFWCTRGDWGASRWSGRAESTVSQLVRESQLVGGTVNVGEAFYRPNYLRREVLEPDQLAGIGRKTWSMDGPKVVASWIVVGENQLAVGRRHQTSQYRPGKKVSRDVRGSRPVGYRPDLGRRWSAQDQLVEVGQLRVTSWPEGLDTRRVGWVPVKREDGASRDILRKTQLAQERGDRGGLFSPRPVGSLRGEVGLGTSPRVVTSWFPPGSREKRFCSISEPDRIYSHCQSGMLPVRLRSRYETTTGRRRESSTRGPVGRGRTGRGGLTRRASWSSVGPVVESTPTPSTCETSWFTPDGDRVGIGELGRVGTRESDRDIARTGEVCSPSPKTRVESTGKSAQGGRLRPDVVLFTLFYSPGGNLPGR